MMNFLLVKDFIKILGYLEKKELLFLIFSFLLSVINIFIEMLSITVVPILLINFLGLEQTIFNNQFFNYLKDLNLIQFIFLICLIFLFKSFYTYLHSLFDFIIFKRLRIRFSNEMYSLLLKKPFIENIKTPPATKVWLINNISIFIKILQNYLIFFKSIIFIIFISLTIISINFKYFFSLYLGLILILIIFYFFFNNKIKIFGKNMLLVSKDIEKTIIETFDGLKNIIIYNQKKFFEKIFRDLFFSKEKSQQKTHLISQLPLHFIEFIGVLILCSFIYFSIQNNTNQGNFIYSFGFLSYGSIRFLSFLKLTINTFNVIKNKSYALDLVLGEIDKNKNETRYTLDNFITYGNKLSENNFAIEIKDLTFQYPGSDTNLFEIQNFNFKKKTFYIIEGESGQGKSTLLDILTGIISPNTGTIKFNPEKNKIGYISQETFILNDSLKKNIAFGLDDKSIDNKKILQIFKKLKLEDHFNTLKDGLDTILLNRGLNFSVGQKQRLGIARALYLNPEILFLDEPTSSLDKDTTKSILKILEDLSNEITVIMVSHKENFGSIKNQRITIKDGTFYFNNE